MSSPELENLVRAGKLKREPPGEKELPHTVGAPASMWRVLAKAHERRNAVEYRGYMEHDERLLAELISATRSLREMVRARIA